MAYGKTNGRHIHCSWADRSAGNERIHILIVNVYVCNTVYACACVSLCVYVCVRACVPACVYVYVYVYLYVYVNVYVYVYVCMRMLMHARLHVFRE